MNILNIAYYNILRNFRDKKSLSLMLLLPIILMLILGTALGSVFTPDNISKTDVCYLKEDTGFMADSFDKFLESEEISKLLNIKPVKSKEEAIELIKNKEATALIVLPADFSDKILKGDKAAIEIYNSKYSSFRASIVQSIFNGFVNAAKAQLVVRQMGDTASEYKLYDNIQEIAIAAKGNTPTAIDYYAVTMLVMTIMYGASYGNYAIKEEKRLNTNTRLASAPIRYVEIILGKLMASIVTVFLQALIIIAFTKIVFKVNWGGNILFIIFVCFSLTLLSVGLGIMVSNLGKNPQATGALLSFGVNIATFISGGYFPTSEMSPVFVELGHISPNYLAQQAMFNTIYGGSTAQTFNLLAAIWIIAALAFVIAGLTERRSAN